MGRQLTDDISNSEIIADEKKSEIFFSMLNGKTVKDAIETSRGNFVIKFPKQKDIISIGRLAALMRGGIPAVNFDAASEYEIQKCATLDIVITEGPDWYEKAKKQNKNFSWRDVPDARFVDEVYAKALLFRQGVQDSLAGNQETNAAKTDGENAGGVSADVGDGVFSGVSGSAKGN